MRTILTAAVLVFAFSQAFAQQVTDPVPANQKRGEVTVPGVIERPVPAPPGDSRTVRERMRDIRNWDKCVIRAQAVSSDNPTRPQLETPEDYCRGRLGMQSRTAVPFNRR